MFCSIHIPLTDVRQFLIEPTGRHPLPNWALARAGRDFLRSTGQVKLRPRGGLDEWPGEECYCDISSAIRFGGELGYLLINGVPSNVRLRCAFRRLYSYGVVSRAVIGFQIGGRFLRRDSLAADDLAVLVRSILDLGVRVPQASRACDERPLRGLGRSLAAYLLRVSTRPDASAHVKPHWLEAGEPQVHIEFDEGELVELPRFSRVLQGIQESDGRVGEWTISPGCGPIGVWGSGWKVGHWRSESGSGPVGTWLLKRESSTDPDWLRRLRIHLSRLHSERESLKVVLRQLADQKISLVPRTGSSDVLQEFLTGSIRLLERATRYGFAQSPMLDIASRCTELISPGVTSSLKAQLSSARRNTLRVVSEYVERENARRRASIIYRGDMHMTTITFAGNVQVSGDFNVVVAERIENSFNKAANSTAETQIKEAIKELGVQVAELAKVLPPTQADAVSRDYETLTNEALAEHPRKGWFELSTKGLMEAAASFATLARPIANTVEKLMRLLRLV